MEELPHAKASSGGSSSMATVDEDQLRRECEQLKESLPRAELMGDKFMEYQGIWYPEGFFRRMFFCQRNFQPLDTDIFVATKPKCGTTWLKALVFALVNRHKYPDMADHPLSKSNPHDLVPFIQFFYRDNPFPDLTVIPSPRIFGTHVAFDTMFGSNSSSCRVIYMSRNPLDAFASTWNFVPSIGGKGDMVDIDLEATFDKFCQGVQVFGPHLDFDLGYWKASHGRPDMVLFLKYEDVKQHPDVYVKRIADFLGCPFSSEEERDGKVGEIIKLCSFETMKNLDINKKGTFTGMDRPVQNKLFFRKGEVGDWANLISPSMARRYSDIADQKLQGSGLSFKFTIE